MAIAEVFIAPVGTGSTSLSDYVADIHRFLAREAGGIKYQLTAMGTILEGDLDELLALIRKMHEVPFEAGSKRVLTVLKIDDRRDKKGTIEGKVKAVQEKL